MSSYVAPASTSGPGGDSVAAPKFCAGIIGTGTIASLFTNCLSRAFPGEAILLSGRNAAALAHLAKTVDEVVVVGPDWLAANADFIFLAVPPEAYTTVLTEIRLYLKSEAIVISLTNGIALSVLGTLVDNPIVKVIPTIAQAVGRGCTLVVPGPGGVGEPVDRVVRLLNAFSKPVVIDEADSRVASNIAASALAFFAEFANLLVSAHEGRQGRLDKQTLCSMAGETMGAIADLVAEGYTLESIIESTAAPGGMTEAALKVLRGGGLALTRATIDETFRLQALLQSQLAR
jgi:pyrroline-5-carboxylate reductase